jgi:hypothetical protein
MKVEDKLTSDKATLFFLSKRIKTHHQMKSTIKESRLITQQSSLQLYKLEIAATRTTGQGRIGSKNHQM